MNPRQPAVGTLAKMNARPFEAAKVVFSHMQDWLKLPPATYEPRFLLLALHMPTEKLIQAFLRARSRKPAGDLDALTHFCNLCDSMCLEIVSIHSRN